MRITLLCAEALLDPSLDSEDVLVVSEALELLTSRATPTPELLVAVERALELHRNHVEALSPLTGALAHLVRHDRTMATALAARIETLAGRLFSDGAAEAAVALLAAACAHREVAAAVTEASVRRGFATPAPHVAAGVAQENLLGRWCRAQSHPLSDWALERLSERPSALQDQTRATVERVHAKFANEGTAAVLDEDHWSRRKWLLIDDEGSSSPEEVWSQHDDGDEPAKA